MYINVDQKFIPVKAFEHKMGKVKIADINLNQFMELKLTFTCKLLCAHVHGATLSCSVSLQDI